MMLFQIDHANHLGMATWTLDLALLILLRSHLYIARVNGCGAPLHLEQAIRLQPVKPKPTTVGTAVNLNAILYNGL
jgi:hypothetical protein